MDPLVYCGQLKTLNLCLSHPAPCHLGGIGCTQPLSFCTITWKHPRASINPLNQFGSFISAASTLPTRMGRGWSSCRDNSWKGLF